jgi:hypothetical protein
LLSVDRLLTRPRTTSDRNTNVRAMQIRNLLFFVRIDHKRPPLSEEMSGRLNEKHIRRIYFDEVPQRTRISEQGLK